MMLQEKLYSWNPFIFFEKIRFHKWQSLFSLFGLIFLLCISNFLAYNKLLHNQNKFTFYQNEFSPAVMYACGYPFSNTQKSPAIDDFLAGKTDSFSCETIGNQSLKPLSFFQSVEYYLIFSAGIVWKIFGIGWANLIPLFLILYSATTVAIYCLFRLAMRNSIAFLLTCIISLSPLQISLLFFLRDYSVAPFLLWTIWFGAKLVIDNPPLKTRFLFCAAAGLITGVGLGFRTDLLVIIPYFMILLFFFTEKKSSFFQGKIIPALLFILFFLPAGYPILHQVSQFGSNLPHVMILGLSDIFTKMLSLQQPEMYSIIPVYLDSHAFNIINSFADRVYDAKETFTFPTKEYDLYGNLFLLNYAYYFPADFLIRIYASIYKILVLPFENNPAVTNALLRHTAILFPLLSIIALACYRSRLALCLLFSFIYICSYPAIQFAPRHYFYLEFVGLWFAGFMIELLISWFYSKNESVKIQQVQVLVQARWKTVLVAGVLFIMTGYGLLYAARIYQRQTLMQTFNQYLNLPKTALERNPIDADTIRIPLPIMKIHDLTRRSLKTSFIKITTENCPLQEILLNLNYPQESEISDMPREINIPGKDGVYFFPVYHFYRPGPDVINALVESMQISSIENACLKDFSIVHTDNTTPLLLYAKLESGWERHKLYQQFILTIGEKISYE